jgi:hypothetical protein
VHVRGIAYKGTIETRTKPAVSSSEGRPPQIPPPER